MRIVNKYILFNVFIFSNTIVKADDGMWIPLLLKGHTITDMQKKGFKLTAEDIYSINHGCSTKQYIQLLDNIANIVKINKSIKNSEFVLSTSMLVSENNWDTIDKVVKLAGELGFDFIQVRAPSGSLKIDYKTKADLHKEEQVKKIIQKALTYQRDDFLVDIRIDSFETQNKGAFKKDFTKCYGIEFETLIDADGFVYPCLRFWGDRDYAIGDLSKNSFEEIWRSNRKKEIFNKIFNDIDLDICYMVCKQSFINKDLEELRHPPLHKGFL